MRENGYINNIMTSNIISSPKSGIIMTNRNFKYAKVIYTHPLPVLLAKKRYLLTKNDKQAAP